MRTYVFHITLTDPSRDLTWNAFTIIIVSALELYIGIVSRRPEHIATSNRNSYLSHQICASVPAIKPFVARYLPIMLENPRYWLSKQADSRARDPFDKPPAGKSLEPDFWLVTERDSVATFQDIESNSGLVFQMQPRPPMPGMPTPTRPPRTASTMQTGTALSTITTTTTNTTTSDNISAVSANSAVPAPLRVMKSPRASTAGTVSSRPDLNKPLPRIGTAVLDASFASEAASSQAQKHMSSVYQFIPHEDGHISVHKARKSAFGNG